MTEAPGSQPPLVNPPQPAIPPATPYAPEIFPPPKKGPSALKIVLIIVGIFLGLGIIAAGFVGYAVYKVAKSANMTTSSQPVAAADLGVPLYPGAEPGKSVRMTMMGNDMVTANFVTSDPRDQVIAFYKSNLGPSAVDVTTFNGESLRLDKGAGESVTVTVSDQPGGMRGKTQIVILHMSKAVPKLQ